MTGENDKDDMTLEELIKQLEHDIDREPGDRLTDALRTAISQRNTWMTLAFGGKEHEESVAEEDFTLMNILRGTDE